MPQLSGTRIGWENEHLAAFLLSRICFVSNPITVADDIGSDFFCTLFERSHRQKHELLFPLNSLAVQVKTRGSSIDVTDKIEYLQKLELPFFLGIIDRPNLRMPIYSGEFLPILFSEHPVPEHLRLTPVRAPVYAPAYCEMHRKKGCILKMPFVLELSASDDIQTLVQKSSQLRRLCTRTHENISARTSQEYIFKVEEENEEIAYMMAGSGSYKRFRYNFCLRLAEAFYNLEWLHMHRPDKVNRQEFQVYERCYLDFIKQGFPIPQLLVTRYESLKNRLANS